MGQSSSYQIAGVAIAICLVIAGFITIFTTPKDGIQQSTQQISSAGIGDNGTLRSEETDHSLSGNKMRILWYDSTTRTYTFRDYPYENQDYTSWSEENLPALENGTVQRQAAMVRFLEWDATMEKMVGTRYLTDQDTITGILNSYTLIPPPLPVTPTPTKTPLPTLTEPTLQIPASLGMLIPTRGQPCNGEDGTIKVSFGYTSRHDTPVTQPIGEMNRFSSSEPNREQPTVFLPGVHTDVFSVSFPANGTNIVWNLMNTAVGAGYVPPLVSGLIVEPQSGYAPLTVRFTDKSSGGTIENRLFGTWNLGDGTNAEGTSVIRRYEQPGTYQVSRTVRTSCGSETSSATVQVHKADFTSKAIPEALNTYQFNDQSEGNPSAWLWDFSDGTTALDQNPIHTWKKPGRYPVGLRVAGENGSGTVVREIVIPDNQENQEKTSQSSLERIYLSSP